MTNNIGNLSYVLITPARNEEHNIGRVIESVLAQTVLPLRWVIVSDGSTDNTDNIVKSHQRQHPWIEFIRTPEHRDRHFAAKVKCFNSGYDKVKGLNFHVIGNLDADISFKGDYFEFLIGKFMSDPQLGVTGTPFVEDGKQYDYRFTNIEHVSGACQLFRRECFEEIGGYLPIKGGGIDWVAVTTARMQGWKTQTFTDKSCVHHRKMGTGNTSHIMIWFRQGRKDYILGNHPLWEVFRSCYQMTNRPFIIGGGLLLIGFLAEALKKTTRPIPCRLVEFVRKEQMQRLQNALRLGLFRK